MTNRIFLILQIIVLAVVVPCFIGGAVAWAETPREQLRQMVEQLQKTPTDNALREKIIKLAQELKPAPAVPEEARRYLARGIAAFETAKNDSDFKLAVSEFLNAANAAPWWSHTYFNLAKVQEKTGDFKGAIVSYRLYLVADPNAIDAEGIRTQSYKLEFMAEQKAKEDEAKAIESEAKLQRQRWASDLVRWLQTNYGGRLERQSRCIIDSVGGCTEQEMEGKHWMSTLTYDESSSVNLLRENRRFIYRVFGKDNDQIQVTMPYFDYLYCGVPTGSSIGGVKWSYCGEKDDFMKKPTPEAWFEFSRSKDDKPWIGVTSRCDAGSRCSRERNVLEN